MKPRSVIPMQVAKFGTIALSAVFCTAGILMMAAPESVLPAWVDFFGVSMMLFGVIKLVGYFSKDLYRLAFQYDLQFGILMISLGFITTVKSDSVLYFLCIALSISILADGLFKMQIAIDAKRFGIGAWWLIVALAVVAGAVGLLLVFRPAESLRVMTVLLGSALLADGILNMCVAISTVKIIHHQMPDDIGRPDVIDAAK